jgi:plastocyanin
MKRVFTVGIALAVALTVGCGYSSPSGPTTPAPGLGGGAGGADVVINILGVDGNMSFNPPSATIKAGQTVSWHNTDAITHTATADVGAFGTGGVAPGTTTAPLKMTEGGTLSYHCSIHPSMVGTLIVQ